MDTNGKYLRTTLEALHLEDATEVAETTRNASNIVGAIISAYGGTTEIGIDRIAVPPGPATGLVYGRIQSGKTRAMIASTALAFDNGFRISIVMTSNINDLVSQTHLDFSSGLPGVMTFTKDNDFDKEVANTKVQMEKGDARLLIVCSKGAGSLQNVSAFLRTIGGENYPAIIFDDEGDQASLDTNTHRRSSGAALAPSSINQIIQSQLRIALTRHVYVSVTGTPQAVLLQSADASHRPSFIVMLPPGASYIGGDHFFGKDEPEDNEDHLVSIIEQNEKEEILNDAAPIPNGLRRSILFFLIASAAAIKNKGPQEKGYSYLCHPSLKNIEQDRAEARINTFLTEITETLLDNNENAILRELREAYEELKRTLGEETPNFDELKGIVRQQLATRRLLVINAKIKRQGIAYGGGLNFLIGGNTLGRGIAVKNLLVTYYVRDSKMSQIDTMHQHARMYGYRSATLKYTKLYIPRHLYYRFRDIHFSDTDLRNFIDAHKDDLPSSFPVEYTNVLRATRPSVLDADKTDTLRPGLQIYPNYVVVPQPSIKYANVLTRIRSHLGFTTELENAMAETGRAGVTITRDEAIELVEMIKTRSQNTWRDKTIGAVITKVAERMGDSVTLKFRTAERTVREDGFMSTGTLSGDELTQARGATIPTLWIMAVHTTPDSAAGAGQQFMYPTFVIPESLGSLFIFNKG